MVVFASAIVTLLRLALLENALLPIYVTPLPIFTLSSADIPWKAFLLIRATLSGITRLLIAVLP